MSTTSAVSMADGVFAHLANEDARFTGVLQCVKLFCWSTIEHPTKCLQEGNAADDDHAVERDTLPGADNYDITDRELFDWKDHDITVAPSERFIGAEFHERVDRFAGTVNCVRLQNVRERKQKQQRRLSSRSDSLFKIIVQPRLLSASPFLAAALPFLQFLSSRPGGAQ
jgi:hypothetical protein